MYYHDIRPTSTKGVFNLMSEVSMVHIQFVQKIN